MTDVILPNILGMFPVEWGTDGRDSFEYTMGG